MLLIQLYIALIQYHMLSFTQVHTLITVAYVSCGFDTNSNLGTVPGVDITSFNHLFNRNNIFTQFNFGLNENYEYFSSSSFDIFNTQLYDSLFLRQLNSLFKYVIPFNRFYSGIIFFSQLPFWSHFQKFQHAPQLGKNLCP